MAFSAASVHITRSGRVWCATLWMAVLVCPFLAAQEPAPEDPKTVALQSPPVIMAPGDAYSGEKRIFQGIPGLARTANGRLWATWYGGGDTEGPQNYVMLSTSGDDGNTWSPLSLVIDPPGLVRAFDPCIWCDPQGRLWLFWAQGITLWDGRAGVWAMTAEDADRADTTWSAPRRIGDGIMMNKPTVLRSGAWMLPAAIWAMPSVKNPDPKFLIDNTQTTGSWVLRSDDQGKTFTAWGRSNVPERSCDEPMIVERNDGRLWMLVRTSYGIGESFSEDGGKTWSPGKPSETVKHIDSAARFFIRRLTSGKLLLVKHAPSSNHGRSHLTAFLSEDDGATWEGGLLLDERLGVSYPDGVESSDGRIYLIYDYSRYEAKEILMAVFREMDIVQGRASSPDSRFRVLVNKATGTR